MTSGVRGLFAGVVTVAVLSTSFAGAAHGAWDIDALMRSLSEVKTAKGRFVERKHMAILTAPLEFSGTLLYQAPGRIEKRTTAPDPLAMVVDGDRLVIEDGTSNRRRTLMLREYPVVWAFVESVRSTLAGDLVQLRRFYDVRLEGDERNWRLLLIPIGTEMRDMVMEIRLGGRGSRITTIEILEAGGGRSLMTITGDAP